MEPDDNTEEGARKRLSGHFNLETLVNAEDLDPVTDASKDFKSTEEEVEEATPVVSTPHDSGAGDEALAVNINSNPTKLDTVTDGKILLELKAILMLFHSLIVQIKDENSDVF